MSPLVRAVIDSVDADVGRLRTLGSVAAAVHRSASHLNLVFRRETGLTVREYMLYVRMTRAAREIAEGTKIEAVSLLVGYRSRQSFYRQFAAWFGTTPRGFRATASRRRGDGEG